MKHGTHPDSSYYRMYVSLARTRNALCIADHSQAATHFAAAHAHAGDHAKSLTTNHKHDELASFAAEIKPFFDTFDKTIKAKGRLGKSDQAAKSAAIFVAHKAAATTGVEAAVATGRQTARGVSPTVSLRESGKGGQKIGTKKIPGHDPRHDYAPFHALSSTDQMRASHAFGSKDMHSYHYPIDKKTGEFVHSTRAKMGDGPQYPASQEHGIQNAQAQASLKPEHRVGAGVRINAPGHEHHERFGVIRQSNPSMGGKVAVEVDRPGNVIHVEPHQVRLNKSLTSLKEGATIALANIKSRLVNK